MAVPGEGGFGLVGFGEEFRDFAVGGGGDRLDFALENLDAEDFSVGKVFILSHEQIPSDIQRSGLFTQLKNLPATMQERNRMIILLATRIDSNHLTIIITCQVAVILIRKSKEETVLISRDIFLPVVVFLIFSLCGFGCGVRADVVCFGVLLDFYDGEGGACVVGGDYCCQVGECYFALGLVC